MTTPRVTVPVEPEYTATDYLRLIAEGWEVIESTGSQMTIQNPEDDGPQDLVIDVDLLSAAPAPEGGDVGLIHDLTTYRDSCQDGLVRAPRSIFSRAIEALATREEAPACKKCSGKGYTEHEGGEGEGYPSRPEIEACSCREEAPAEAGEEDGAWIIYFEDRDRELEAFSGFGAREAAQRRYEQVTVSWNAHLFERVKSALPVRAQPPAREDAHPVSWEVEEFQEARRRIAAFRIREYLARHAKNTHGNRVAIHSYDLGEDDETRLLISDLEAVSAPQTHPAPDALRVAVEALEPFAKGGHHRTMPGLSPSYTVADFRDGVVVTVADFRRAAEAFAALQAEQKGGA